jgi:uncharacterized protein (TIGR02284 family)
MQLETSSPLTDETVSRLQDLIQLNLDSRDGFQQVSEQLDNLTIATFCRSLSQQRSAQASELQSLVRKNNEEPTERGSVAAALHRTWMQVREALSSSNVYALLAEAERGEDQIKQAYEEVLRDVPDSAVNDILLRQYQRIKAAHDRIRDLRDEHAST